MKTEKLGRRDGRQPMLLYIAPEIARALKVRAAELDTHAYLLVEEMLREKLLSTGKAEQQ
ncbi:hypothetical protein [Devosia sp.]|uniref:hypothetical protein n=1 Tax=Devosia sp. TaxID=1871048 RepID=UPI0025F5480F|nr:hypothetical protein [Devosia sp.]MCR6634764.1 hypothetical protein [Devosia sp.]